MCGQQHLLREGAPARTHPAMAADDASTWASASAMDDAHCIICRLALHHSLTCDLTSPGGSGRETTRVWDATAMAMRRASRAGSDRSTALKSGGPR